MTLSTRHIVHSNDLFQPPRTGRTQITCSVFKGDAAANVGSSSPWEITSDNYDMSVGQTNCRGNTEMHDPLFERKRRSYFKKLYIRKDTL